MKYVRLGKTEFTVSHISFGGIPIQRGDVADTVEVVDSLEKHGINFIDTARVYTVSEEYLGKALSGRRGKFILATKSITRDYEGVARDIDISLKNLRTDYIDLYQIHNIKPPEFDAVFGEGGAFEALSEAKQAGKIRHIGATTHTAQCMERLVNEYSDLISTIMFPYNIVETQGEEAFRAARAKDIGTIAMKPLAGGNLEDYKLALRFVAASGVCDISIPGMGNAEEVEKNAAVAHDASPLSAAELAEVERLRKELGNQFCRRCGYCAPCAVGMDIPNQFVFANYLRNYGLSNWAKERYAAMPKKASDCIECGICEERCPYNLPIREMLKEVAKDFKAAGC